MKKEILRQEKFDVVSQFFFTVVVMPKHNWDILSNFSGIIKNLKLHNLKNVYFLSLLSLLREKVHYRKLIAPIVQMSSRHEDANQKSFDFTNFAFLFIIKSANFANIIKIGTQSCLDCYPKLSILWKIQQTRIGRTLYDA